MCSMYDVVSHINIQFHSADLALAASDLYWPLRLTTALAAVRSLLLA